MKTGIGYQSIPVTSSGAMDDLALPVMLRFGFHTLRAIPRQATSVGARANLAPAA
jgi:hypothetical protein